MRNHPAFAPAGANANFVQRTDQGIAVRTYERGVEGETLACGTGATAAALAAAHVHGLDSPVRVRVASGDVLTIHFQGEGPAYEKVCLEGPAKTVYRGELAWPL